MGTHSAFLVAKKKFAYYLDNHHGDGRTALNVRGALGQNEDLAQEDSTRYHIPAYLGLRGWIGLYLDVRKVDWKEVRTLVAESYALVAPRRLAAT